MSVLGEQERLSPKAMEVLTELKVIKLKFQPVRSNLYHCEDQPALFSLVQRLTKELEFITVKV
jgi:hypothetical protein